MARILFLLLFGFVSVKAQFKDSSLTLSIQKIHIHNSDVRFDLVLSSNACDAKNSIYHLQTFLYLKSPENSEKIYFEKKLMFTSVSESSCIKGNFKNEFTVIIPLNKILEAGSDMCFELKMMDGSKNFNVTSKPFGLQEFQHQNLTQSYLNVKSQKTSTNSRGINLNMYFDSNTSSSSKIYLRFFLNGKLCSTQIETSIDSGENQFRILHMPYTQLYIPPGSNTLTYEILSDFRNDKVEVIASDTIEFIQPQLFWFEFETKNADINVENMDQKTNIGQAFSSTAGRGNGDAMFEIWNPNEEIFQSEQAKHSGLIKNQQGKFLAHPDEKLRFTFYDVDFWRKEFLANFEFMPIPNQSQKNVIKNEGKIRNFELNYTFYPVTHQNYHKPK
jgi:hypothetical protein